MGGTILYEVTLQVEPAILGAYKDWLSEHMQHMLSLDGFVSAEMFINTENPNEIVCAYRLKDMDAMRAYLAGPAKDMRADGVNRFGDQFSATRRILARE